MQPISPVGCIVFQTKAFPFSFVGTPNNQTFSFKTISRETVLWNVIFRPIYRGVVLFSHFPHIGMAFTHMFSMAIKQFKVLNSIVSFNSIYVMHPFFFSKLSLKVLFHNMTMLKNPFTIYVNTKVSHGAEAGLSFFKNSPIWRNVVKIFMTKPPSSVHIANTSFSFSQYFFTSFNFACLTNHYPYCNKI